MSVVAHRMDLATVTPAAYEAMLRLDAEAHRLDLEPLLVELVKTRASQINGCAYCIDMHTKDARAAGESEERLYMLNAWRESPLYSARERAALALAEAVTRLGEAGVPDDVYGEGRAQFSEQELGAVIWMIIVINAWNRVAITTRLEPGHYVPETRSR
jgi:AhpD family alkylhydroperoxidase